MTKELSEKIILEEIRDLSPETLNEILEFIQFKKLKALGKESFRENIQQELTYPSEISMAHLEGEFADYKERYPREQ